ncbi:hypothetical protein [Deinococcus hopiensis]|uniref:Uncharacterized protein n=1 Tax=Deinococcus hopiensis KR-140 TaxID=695939 RepID=A0A1W1UXJ0_9DEIO|nr:hypothetical protein [Deinococcus hopiensis]SMB85803.1 hypothetical protein SAMN00790413_03549 [Deinococcus hopiensis KR-140]
MRIADLIFNGQNAFPTMQIDAGTQEGDAVAFTGPGRAGRGANGNPLLGKVLKIEKDGYGTVAIYGAGFTDIPAVGTLATGLQNLVVDGAGKALVGSGGKQLLVNGAAAGVANIQL